ncbi:epsilon DNA polymerase [Pterulicium gracile]|uniref:DNA polymerase epsilon subunit n=1 Tax=Pterulicium gracile TaxID=1884261 RepID=A0A5C3QZY7_9AGAR|nr:epsilon DNA polymerase [Pterula gracilis]
MANQARQRAIIKVFRKYSHSLGPDALEFLERVLDDHDIADEDVEASIDMLAKEYNKQDDAKMKVTLSVLQRVYEAAQEQGDPTSRHRDVLDPDSHIHLINAFDMPCWHWSTERGTFEQHPGVLTASGSADSRVACIRDRHHIIKQCILRNEHFAPSTLPSHDRERLVTLRSTKQLLGRFGERFLLLGMLRTTKEGNLCIEDADGTVVLDFGKLDEPGDGLFTEGSFALVEGLYTEDSTLEIIAIGQPPCEPRDISRSIYGHIDFLGKGSTSLLEDAQHTIRIREDLSDLHLFFLSDVWLDHPQTLPGLEQLFKNCVDNSFIPKIIVLCGNFSSRSISQGSGSEVQLYQEKFDALADLIARHPLIARTTHFVLVPGPGDICANSILPRRPILSTFFTRLKSKVPKLHLGSNPCRIKFFNQEIVIFREDTMARMLRNVRGVKPNVETNDLKKFLVQTILDQAHLSPLANNIQPVSSDYDHALRLYPLPTCIVLADKYDRYKLTYSGCHVFNPGSFIGNNYSFSAYKPAEMNSEECILDVQSDEE